MITVYHFSPIDRASPWSAEQARTPWEEGLYTKVATIEGWDLERAWRVTNNINSSWSVEPLPGVNVEGLGYHFVRDGNKVGYRSSMVGDVFVVDGEPWVVAMVGFERLYGDQ
jgi:hypothetical protein